MKAWAEKWQRIIIVFAVVTLLRGVLSVAPVSAQTEGTLQDRIQLVGLYQNQGQQFLVRERSGHLELVIDYVFGNEGPFSRYSLLPLVELTKNTFRLPVDLLMTERTSLVVFARDEMQRGKQLFIDGKRFDRSFFEPELGRNYRIEPLLPREELERRAMSAKPPTESGTLKTPDLVELIKLDLTFRMDIRYAGTDNFMEIRLYAQPRAFLQRPAAEALVRVHQQIKKYGFGLIVYDAYRPWYVTQMFWDATPDNQKIFVADPSRGSRHNRGCAVDLGLYRLLTGEVLDMGSGYDEFSPRAFPEFPGGTSEQRRLRKLLQTLMEGEGFSVYPEEWWHFDFSGWQQYPILNLRFEQL